jgi:hypothetical protein
MYIKSIQNKPRASDVVLAVAVELVNQPTLVASYYGIKDKVTADIPKKVERSVCEELSLQEKMTLTRT